MYIYVLSTLTGAGVSALLALYVLRQNIRSIYNLTFGAATLSVCAIQIGIFKILTAPDSSEALFWSRASLIGVCLALPWWTIFSCIFLKADYKAEIKARKWSILAVGLGGLIVLPVLPSALFIENVSKTAEGYLLIVSYPYGYALATCMLLAVILVLFNLERTFRRIGVTDRKTVKPMFFGTVAASILYVFILSLAVLFRALDVRLIATGSLGVVFAGVLSAYSIVRYRLLDSRVIIGRKVTYSSLTFLLAGLFLMAVGLLGRFLHRAGGGSTVAYCS